MPYFLKILWVIYKDNIIFFLRCFKYIFMISVFVLFQFLMIYLELFNDTIWVGPTIPDNFINWLDKYHPTLLEIFRKETFDYFFDFFSVDNTISNRTSLIIHIVVNLIYFILFLINLWTGYVLFIFTCFVYFICIFLISLCFTSLPEGALLFSFTFVEIHHFIPDSTKEELFMSNYPYFGDYWPLRLYYKNIVYPCIKDIHDMNVLKIVIHDHVHKSPFYIYNPFFFFTYVPYISKATSIWVLSIYVKSVVFIVEIFFFIGYWQYLRS